MSLLVSYDFAHAKNYYSTIVEVTAQSESQPWLDVACNLLDIMHHDTDCRFRQVLVRCRTREVTDQSYNMYLYVAL